MNYRSQILRLGCPPNSLGDGLGDTCLCFLFIFFFVCYSFLVFLFVVIIIIIDLRRRASTPSS